MLVSPRAIPSLVARPRCVTRESSSTASSSCRCRRASLSIFRGPGSPFPVPRSRFTSSALVFFVSLWFINARNCGLRSHAAARRFEELLRLDEADARLTPRELQKLAQHAFALGVHLPVVGGDAEVAAVASRLFKSGPQRRERRAGHEAVAPELRVSGVAQRMGIDERIAPRAPARAAIAPDPPPVDRGPPLPRPHRWPE